MSKNPSSLEPDSPNESGMPHVKVWMPSGSRRVGSVECLLCHREFKDLRPHLLRIHGITTTEYRARFGDAVAVIAPSVVYRDADDGGPVSPDPYSISLSGISPEASALYEGILESIRRGDPAELSREIAACSALIGVTLEHLVRVKDKPDEAMAIIKTTKTLMAELRSLLESNIDLQREAAQQFEAEAIALMVDHVVSAIDDVLDVCPHCGQSLDDLKMKLKERLSTKERDDAGRAVESSEGTSSNEVIEANVSITKLESPKAEPSEPLSGPAYHVLGHGNVTHSGDADNAPEPLPPAIQTGDLPGTATDESSNES